MKKYVLLAALALAAPASARIVTTITQVGCAVVTRTTGIPRSPDRLDVDLTGCRQGTADDVCTWRVDGVCVEAGVVVEGNRHDRDVVIRFAPAE